jgi:hypothetical protein
MLIFHHVPSHTLLRILFGKFPVTHLRERHAASQHPIDARHVTVHLSPRLSLVPTFRESLVSPGFVVFCALAPSRSKISDVNNTSGSVKATRSDENTT